MSSDAQASIHDPLPLPPFPWVTLFLTQLVLAQMLQSMICPPQEATFTNSCQTSLEKPVQKPN